MSILSQKHFHNEAAAYKYIEGRLWADGRVCPHCGCIGRSGALKGKTTREGLYKCYECRKPFTVKIGTIFEDSRIKLHIWLQGIALIAASKKGISANQLSRVLGISVSSAWHMAHRIRVAMADTNGGTFGGNGGVVEMDETYFGYKAPENRRTTRVFDGKPYKTGQRGPANKRAVVSMVERGGKVRSFHVESASKETVAKIVVKNIAKEATLHTDESRLYTGADAHVSKHESIRHAAGEYARGEVTTNSIEGYFSIFKRGMTGVYQHCDEKNLHRYLSEFDFRFNTRVALGYNDQDRADIMLQNVVGKRLKYERPSQANAG